MQPPWDERQRRRDRRSPGSHGHPSNNADPVHAPAVVAHELDRLAAIGTVGDHRAVGTVEGDGHSRRAGSPAVRSLLHEQFRVLRRARRRSCSAARTCRRTPPDRVAARAAAPTEASRRARGARSPDSARMSRRDTTSALRARRPVSARQPVFAFVSTAMAKLPLGHDLEQQDVTAERAAVRRACGPGRPPAYATRCRSRRRCSACAAAACASARATRA